MAKKFAIFAFTFIALFALTYVFLAMVDMLPEPSSEEAFAASEEQPVDQQALQIAEEPVRIEAKNIGMKNTVLNPESTDIEVLDEALLKGVVHYPQSAKLGVDGTVLIFGHSSYLPIVHNQNFKAFDGIQNLKAGETISVYSSTTEYRYAVTGVRLADANEDVVELPNDGKYLTLITCDSFGKKTQRYVVTAKFEGAYTLTVNAS